MSDDLLPGMYALSTGLLGSNRVPIYTGPPLKPEMILTPVPRTEAGLAMTGFLSEWNLFWEAGPYRPDSLLDDLPEQLAWVEKLGERWVDAVLVPVEDGNEYDACAPLYHLIPRRILRKHRLPCFKRGHWPRLSPSTWHHLPRSARPALQRAFAETVGQR